MPIFEDIVGTGQQTKTGIDAATEGFKQMQKALLIFAGVASIALLISAVSIFKK